MPELVVSVGGVETQHVHLNKDRVTLGRRHHNDVSLADLSVSGMHCVFERHGPSETWLKDLGSTNGTFVNGERIQQCRLDHQDLIYIGIYTVQYFGRPASAEAGDTSPLKLEAIGLPGTAGAMNASLRVLSGASAGRDVPVVKAVTTFGTPGVAVVAISHRRNGYYVARVEGGNGAVSLNGQSLGTDARPLADRDVVGIADTQMLFQLAP